MSSAKHDEEFAAYVAKSRPALWRTAYLLCGNEAHAEDLVQSALLKLYVAWPRLVREDRLDGYTRRIVVNSHIDELRRPWRRESEPLDGHEPVQEMANDDHRLLIRALKTFAGRAAPGGRASHSVTSDCRRGVRSRPILSARRPRERKHEMRHTPHYLMTDPDEVRRLIRGNPWATIVSPAGGGLVASHYPVILDERAEGPDITVLSHFGRPDDRLHELGRHEILVIIQGPHDYISPSWYAQGDLVATWNHVTAHLYGTPEILDEEENYAALSLLTDHFEGDRPGGRSLAEDEAATRREARGAVSFRMRVDRFDARAKLSQNKAPEVIDNVVDQVAQHNPGLAEEMRRVRTAPDPER